MTVSQGGSWAKRVRIMSQVSVHVKHMSPLSGQFAQSRELISNTNNRTERRGEYGCFIPAPPSASDCAVKRISVDEELRLTHHGQATVTEGFTPPWHEETFPPLGLHQETRTFHPLPRHVAWRSPKVYRSGYRCIRRKKRWIQSRPSCKPLPWGMPTVQRDTWKDCGSDMVPHSPARELPWEIRAWTCSSHKVPQGLFTFQWWVPPSVS